MKALALDQSCGEVVIIEAPEPEIASGCLKVLTTLSAISLGTESQKIETAKKSIFGKALQKPEQVAKVIDYARSNGLQNAYNLAKSRLDTLQPLGYSATGTVLEVGSGVKNFNVGDRVTICGAGFANHAQINIVPSKLCHVIPPEVQNEQAAMVAIGGIALHAIHQAELTNGETVLVIGYGLIGRLLVKFLIAYGYQVLVHDKSAIAVERLPEGAKRFNSEDQDFQIDCLIITASSNSSSIVQTFPKFLRDRGRIVIVGDVGLNFSREVLYQKEIDIKIARSYGPGRYDANYEIFGQDYPIGYSRWTINRIQSEIIRLIRTKRVDFSDLIGDTIELSAAPDFYKNISNRNKPGTTLINYNHIQSDESHIPLKSQKSASNNLQVVGNGEFGFIGTGNFATRVLMPAFKASGARIGYLFSQSGFTATSVGKKIKSAEVMTSVDSLLNKAEYIVIATRHDSHAELISKSIALKKKTYVEKPLCLDENQLSKLLELESLELLTVGHNRIHSPHVKEILKHFPDFNDCNIVIDVAASKLEKHWSEMEIQGGRFIGEVCHFVHLAHYLVKDNSYQVSASYLLGESQENFTIRLDALSRNTTVVINYLTSNNTAFPKENITIHSKGRSVAMQNYKKTIVWENSKKSVFRTRKSEKGHTELASNFVNYCQGKSLNPIPIEEVVESMRLLFLSQKLLKSKKIEVINL
jgi:predicted dehydrogenase/threonine dehydrogenase-like Zn-dependent dehydrogenase